MRYLWLTWIDPAPERDGQRIYSGRLIDAVATAGAKVDVLCLASQAPQPETEPPVNRLHWWRVAPEMNRSCSSIFTSLPNIAYRSYTRSMREGFKALAAQKPWDVVVLDGIYSGWALSHLPCLQGKDAKSPKVIYLSHNHEQTLRREVASNFSGNMFKRALLQLDALKAAHLEREILKRADLVTAISEEDAEKFRRNCPHCRVAVLLPGYSGQRRRYRSITSEVPRRAVILGSFDWIAKRMNLEEFLSFADPLFASAGAELQVVGNGERAFLERMRGRVRATSLLGSVPEFEQYLEQSRIAVVPERSGGGFKLKVLDYVFHRLPIAAIEGSVAGTPLRASQSMLTFDNMSHLATGVVSALDDLPLLNRLQNEAYASCSGQFDWQQRAETLLAEADAA